ncbi:hypothetical protein U9W46_000837 [Staphylococcus pseudintermedius]|nr:hypothetical protein [Staphylococcus pseudintermedius]
MLTLKLISKDSEKVTYEYSPEDREKPGRITVDAKTQDVIYAKKSAYEEGSFDLYFIHAISRVRKNTKNNELPETELVAWG